jgi:hypothetical protein
VLRKVPADILTTPLPNVTLESDTALLKAKNPISVTLLGIITDVSAVPANERASIIETVLGI